MIWRDCHILKLEEPTSLMAVPSRADHLRERMAIRNSWGSVVKRYTSLPLIFFVGKKVDLFFLTKK